MTAKRQKTTPEAKAAKREKSKATEVDIAETAVEEKEHVVKKKRFDVEFYRAWCKGCGICVAFCPTEALAMNDKGEPEVVKPDLCIGCAWCEMRCPDFAVRAKEKAEEQVSEA